MRLCEAKYQALGEGRIAPFWWAANLPDKRYSAIWGIAAIVLQYHAIWSHLATGESPDQENL